MILINFEMLSDFEPTGLSYIYTPTTIAHYAEELQPDVDAPPIRNNFKIIFRCRLLIPYH